MAVTLIQQESVPPFNVFEKSSERCVISELEAGEKDEVLEFLDTRPLHTVFMSSMVRDNGLVSPDNRGSFYACRNHYGELEGVGLIGHATMIETQSEGALMSLARLARNCQVHLIRGEQETIDLFWEHYARAGQKPRLICREILLEQREAPAIQNPVDDLRTATLSELDKVLAVNASMALSEAGISPLQKDPAGFRQRTARRIEQGRIWVWINDNRLMFKADVVAETPHTNYLEGVHVHPEERMKGYGLRCLAQLSGNLLSRADSICLTVNEQNKEALAFYAKAGYQISAPYETIYLNENL